MRPLFFLLCLLAAGPVLRAQSLTEAEWQALIQPLSQEKWKAAETVSLSYLRRFKGAADTGNSGAILRYMYLRCVAARLGDKEYSKSEALSKARPLVGKLLITPYLEYRQSGLFNIVHRAEVLLCAANEEATTIFSFEYYRLRDTTLISRLTELEGKQVRLQAVLRSVDAEGYAMPRLEMKLEETEIIVPE